MKTANEYMNENSIEIGKYYSPYKDGTAMVLMCTGTSCTSRGIPSVMFSDGSQYAIDRTWYWFERTPVIDSLVEVDINEGKKDWDNRYYATKKRHRELCDKKSVNYRTGRGNTMRNAYMTQELEMLRSILSEYKSETINETA